MLVSQQIIAALKARLVDAATAAGDRVYTDRNWPLDDAKLPALRIYEQDEAIEATTVHWPHLLTHDLGIAIELCAQAVGGIDETLAALRLQVELALFDSIAHATLGLTGVNLVPRAVGPMQPVESADRQIARRNLLVNANFRTFENDPETLA